MDFINLFQATVAQSDNHYNGKGSVMCESMMEPPHVPCDKSCEGTLFCAPNWNDQQMFSFHADDGTNKVGNGKHSPNF